MLSMAEGLNAAGVEVVQLMVGSPGHPFPDQIPSDYPFQIRRVYLNTRVNVWDALINLAGSASYHLSRFRQQAFRRALIEILQQQSFDIVQAESPYMLVYLHEIRRYSKAKVVLRAHNVEFMIWSRAARSGRNFLVAPYLRLQSARLKREEVFLAKSCDGLVAMSSDDLALLKAQGVQIPSTVIGIGTGLNPPENLPDQIAKRQIFHLGAMNWFPNREGVLWFLNDVWPLVRKLIPGIKLHLAGHGMPAEISAGSYTDVIIEKADNAAAYMLSHGIMIVPLLSGSGIRVKIIEGMKLGKVIVTTEIGAEGLGVVAGEHILIAHGASEFAEQLKRCFEDPALTIKISENARKFAAEKFDTSKLTDQLLQFYQNLLKG